MATPKPKPPKKGPVLAIIIKPVAAKPTKKR
jgi:hypothetical protein